MIWSYSRLALVRSGRDPAAKAESRKQTLVRRGKEPAQAASLQQPRQVPSGAQIETINAQQAVHPHRQIGLGRLQHLVKMVAHQPMRMRSPAGLLTGLRDRLQQVLPILVIIKAGLATVALFIPSRSPQDIEWAPSESCAKVSVIDLAASAKQYNLIN